MLPASGAMRPNGSSQGALQADADRCTRKSIRRFAPKIEPALCETLDFSALSLLSFVCGSAPVPNSPVSTSRAIRCLLGA